MIFKNCWSRNIRGLSRFLQKNYDFSIYNFLEFEIKLKEKYDFFRLWDVIEHLKDPNKYIDRISELSNKDSINATTGNIESLNSKIFGENWRLIHPPTHLHYFSYNSIKTLLEKIILKLFILSTVDIIDLLNLFFIN